MAREVPYPHMSDQEKCAYIRQRAHSVAEAVELAAWTMGIIVAEHQARFLAEVAQSFSDNVVHVRQVARKDEWAFGPFRDHLRKAMRHELIDAVAQQGYIPLALPAETLRYMDRFFLPGTGDVAAPGGPREVPAEVREVLGRPELPEGQQRHAVRGRVLAAGEAPGAQAALLRAS